MPFLPAHMAASAMMNRTPYRGAVTGFQYTPAGPGEYNNWNPKDFELDRAAVAGSPGKALAFGIATGTGNLPGTHHGGQGVRMFAPSKREKWLP